jgi:putative zinc ribbon protein
MERLCVVCKQTFVMSESELKFYEERIAAEPGRWYLPRRCKACRAQRKLERSLQQEDRT